MSTIDDCALIELDRVASPGGSLTAVEGGVDVPFPIERVYYLYDVPGGETRGGHAHRELRQLFVAVMGAFDLVLDDGVQRKTIRLDRSYHAVLVPEMIWRELENFSAGGICMVLASQPFTEADYIRTYDGFLEAKGLA